MIFPIPKSKFRLLELVYDTPGLNISELLKRARVSPKAGYMYLNQLKDSRIIIQETKGKKPFLKITLPNIKSEEGKLLFSLLEEDRKIKFFMKHKEFRGPFEQLANESSTKKTIHSILIFGSYARGSETADSDLDVVVIAEDSEKDYIKSISERAFVTLKVKASLRVINKKEFLALKEKDEFIKSIIKNHICVFGSGNFIHMIA